MSQIHFLVERALRFRTELARISALQAMGALTTLTLPWLAGQLLGGVVEARIGSTSTIVLALVALLILSTLFKISGAMVSARTSAVILAQLRLDTYRKIQRLPMKFHNRSNQGELLSLMTYEISRLSDFLTNTIATVPAMVLTAAGAIVILFVIDPLLALLIPILVPIFYILLRFSGRKLRANATKMRDAETEVFNKAEMHLEMLSATKAFAVEDTQFDLYTAAIEDAQRKSALNEQINSVISPLVGLIAALAALAVILLGGLQIGEGGRTPGELFSALLYAALLTRPIGQIAELWGRLQLARGTLARLQAVITLEPEQGYDRGLLPDTVRGALAFRDVHFSYPGRQVTLRGANLEIAAGEVIAITGENGAGKSTLVNLLLRFYDADQGQITLDGTPIENLQVQALRRYIGYVPQRTMLFSGSLRENVVFGCPQASDEQIAEALRLSQAEAFVADLPKGLDTQIGDHGVRLSGGQCQRIALTRALLLHPQIIIFDEATSMFDLENEALFVKAIKGALSGQTVIIITHRRALLALADRIVKVVDGRFEEVATS
ncbi:MAG: ABC transporter ATP-binding protein [Alteraurantiacibacter sp. bin_em_oilr2.035]|nr:ABC transporter ATP-binding protein [Alteraurantiacibacter sp. bin_em_oilr2.035]